MDAGLFLQARDYLLSGNVEELGHMIDREPDLVHWRYPGTEAPYNGYFHKPTLLHHVAGNPEIVAQPSNDQELASVLLARGANIDAATAAGPDQPTDIGWTVLGLVATSGQPGQLALLDHLVEKGADIEARSGGALRGALYYRQWTAAKRLVEHGAQVDLASAAGLGRLDLIEDMLADGIEPLPSQPRLSHYSQVALPDKPSPIDLLGVALVHACLGGHVPVVVRLLATGIDINMRPCFDHRATALHWAVVGDQRETAEFLLAQGADPTLRDETHHATPGEWCRHLDRSWTI